MHFAWIVVSCRCDPLLLFAQCTGFNLALLPLLYGGPFLCSEGWSGGGRRLCGCSPLPWGQQDGAASERARETNRNLSTACASQIILWPAAAHVASDTTLLLLAHHRSFTIVWWWESTGDIVPFAPPSLSLSLSLSERVHACWAFLVFFFSRFQLCVRCAENLREWKKRVPCFFSAGTRPM